MALKGPDNFVGPRGMLVDYDCYQESSKFLWGAEKVYRPLSLGIGAYTPFHGV